MKRKLFISYSHDDKEIVETYIQGFKELDFEILSDKNILAGEDFTNKIFEMIMVADYLVAMFSPAYLKSNSTIYEYNRMIGYSKNSGKIILPIVIKDTDLPPDFLKAFYIDASKNEIPHNLLRIKHAIDEYEGRMVAEKEKQKQRSEKINSSMADYIEPILSDLEKREQKLRTASTFWNWTGFTSLIIGIAATILIVLFDINIKESINWEKILYLGIKGAILLTLLISTSKYAFTLSKTFMNESLKNANRIHAIKFGKFYIHVFEKTINPSDFKEIFQNWNLNNDSSFQSLSTDSYDPKVFDSMSKILDIIKDFGKKT